MIGLAGIVCANVHGLVTADIAAGSTVTASPFGGGPVVVRVNELAKVAIAAGSTGITAFAGVGSGLVRVKMARKATNIKSNAWYPSTPMRPNGM